MKGKKHLYWLGSSLDDVRSFPSGVRQEVGHALYLAQIGDKGINAVPMLGFGGASVLEAVINEVGNTYRAVYTVRFAMAVYVLHVFQKKSKKGIATPKHDMDVIELRLKAARKHYDSHYAGAERDEQQKDKGGGRARARGSDR